MRFNPGNYAILPTALAEDLVPRNSRLSVTPDVAIVQVEGAMTYSGGPDPACPLITYRMIEDIAQQAFAGPAKAVILAIASPGGEVAGAFECARTLRRMAALSGKPFLAFVDNMACSAGYALASACDQIVATRTALLGSIGVVRMIASTARLDSAMGLDFAVIRSGDLKMLGDQHSPIDDLVVATAQAEVNKMAQAFFAWVTERRGIDDPGAMQGGCFVGSDALAARLCDSIVDTLDDAVAQALAATQGTSSLLVMATDNDENKDDALRASLVTASESDDPEKARKAKAALAAYDCDEHEHDCDEKKDDKGAAEAANAAVASLSKQVAQLSAQIAKRDAEALASETAAFFASRPDLPESLLATLKGLPLNQAKAIVATIPVATPAVTTTQTPTLGTLTPREGKNSLSDRMLATTFKPSAPEVTLGGVKQTFGKVTPNG